jgi:hypothetical protein
MSLFMFLYLECIKVKDQFNALNASGQPATPKDPLTICKALRHEKFSGGYLRIRPLQVKPLQCVKNGFVVSSLLIVFLF